jgi:S-adenosylmethionine hydrolase
VVDPGVGSARRGVALRTPGGFLVGPDNGLLPAAAQALGGADAAVSLTNPDWHAAEVTSTFHGRDIFAPVAARLLAGRDFADAGEPIDVVSLVTLPALEARILPGQLRAQVRMIDRFGNLQLALPAPALAGLATHVTVNGRDATRADAFGHVPAGALLVFADSAGYVAVAVNGGRASATLAVAPGDTLVIEDR